MGRSLSALVLLAGFSILATWPSEASARRVAGLRLSIAEVSGYEVTFDVEAYEASPNGTESALALGGGLDFEQSGTLTSSDDLGFGLAPTTYLLSGSLVGRHGLDPEPAFDFDDGSTLAGADLTPDGTLPDSTLRVFRGSFSHTFAGPGLFDVRATVGPSGEPGELGLGPATAANPGFPALFGDVSVGSIVAELQHRQTVALASAPEDALRVQAGTQTLAFANTITSVSATQQVLLGSCPAAKATDCRSAARGSLTMINGTPDKKDKLIYKWIKGEEAVGDSDFGDPLDATSWTLCLYQGGELIFGSEAPSGTSSISAWTGTPEKGYKYKSKSAEPFGATGAQLKTGAAGKAKAAFIAKGANIPWEGFDLPFSMPVDVAAQLISSDGTRCLGTEFADGDVAKNEAPEGKTAKFKATRK